MKSNQKKLLSFLAIFLLFYIFSFGIKKAQAEDIPKVEMTFFASRSGIVGREYTLPLPNLYVDDESVSFEGNVTVSDSNNNMIVNENTTTSIKFTPMNAGTYDVTFTESVTTTNQKIDVDITILTQDVDSDAVFYNIFNDYNVNDLLIESNSFYLYAEAKSPVYLDDTKPAINANIYKNDIKVATISNIVEKTNYVFSSEGDYKIIYEAKDCFNKSTYSEEILVNIRRNYADFTEQIFNYETISYQYLDQYDGISTDDFYIYDFHLGKIEDFSCSLKVKEPTESLYHDVPNNFKITQLGLWSIKYCYSYFDDSIEVIGEVERKINVIDDVKPTFWVSTEQNIINAVKNTLIGDEENLFFKALVGEELCFSKLHAEDYCGQQLDLSNEIQVNVTIDGVENSDLENAFYANRDLFIFTPIKSGIYVFKFSVCDYVNDTPNLLSFLTYSIDVRDIWIESSTSFNPNPIGDTNQMINITDYKVKNLNGSEINNAIKSFIVKRNGEIVYESSDKFEFMFEISGDYEIIISSRLENVKADDLIYHITIYDKTKPTITVEGQIKLKVFVGEKVELPTVTVEDNEDLISNYELTIIHNGELLNQNDSFITYEAGKYVITYRAVDNSGNEAIYSYEVEAIENSFNIVTVVIGSIIVVGVGIVLISFTKKSKRKGEK